mmetsp:Transcript_25830/g.72001  ORF Transcript_25830/g.72001 Transcript_25830/m.72001 type:complete len:218 (-) Transcript_25830:806-1459(-)
MTFSKGCVAHNVPPCATPDNSIARRDCHSSTAEALALGDISMTSTEKSASKHSATAFKSPSLQDRRIQTTKSSCKTLAFSVHPGGFWTPSSLAGAEAADLGVEGSSASLSEPWPSVGESVVLASDKNLERTTPTLDSMSDSRAAWDRPALTRRSSQREGGCAGRTSTAAGHCVGDSSMRVVAATTSATSTCVVGVNCAGQWHPYALAAAEVSQATKS